MYDSLTVYNDGAVDYRDALQRHFDRERLSDQELSELLRTFAAVDFDTLPADLSAPADSRDAEDQANGCTLSGCLARSERSATRAARVAVKRRDRASHFTERRFC